MVRNSRCRQTFKGLNLNLELFDDLPWAISRDSAEYLQNLDTDPDVLIEFGSGLTTLLFMDKFKDTKTEILTFEHLPKYYKITSELLLTNGHNFPPIKLCPLVNNSEVGPLPYYNCVDHLKSITHGQNVLIFVDGPPAMGTQSRLPALKLVLNTIKPKSGTIIIDDYNRIEEQEIVDNWRQQLSEKCKELYEPITPPELKQIDFIF